jgi:hypothetical protein
MTRDAACNTQRHRCHLLLKLPLLLFTLVVTLCTTELKIPLIVNSVYSTFMCFVWSSEQTATISIYRIELLGCCNRDVVCLLRSTD